MFPLKLKVYIMEGERKIENFNNEQWQETCIIFQKLIRNLKEEVPEVTVQNYCQTLVPYVTMELVFDDSVPEERVSYAMSYLAGYETDNPVYFDEDEEPCMANSDVIFEEDKNESLLERFNKMAMNAKK